MDYQIKTGLRPASSFDPSTAKPVEAERPLWAAMNTSGFARFVNDAMRDLAVEVKSAAALKLRTNKDAPATEANISAVRRSAQAFYAYVSLTDFIERPKGFAELVGPFFPPGVALPKMRPTEEVTVAVDREVFRGSFESIRTIIVARPGTPSLMVGTTAVSAIGIISRSAELLPIAHRLAQDTEFVAAVCTSAAQVLGHLLDKPHPGLPSSDPKKDLWLAAQQAEDLILDSSSFVTLIAAASDRIWKPGSDVATALADLGKAMLPWNERYGLGTGPLKDVRDLLAMLEKGGRPPSKLKKFIHTSLDFCDNCSQMVAKTMRCSACKFARYCSVECQRSAWKEGHKGKCGKKSYQT
ncbi:hypothetical protein DFJ74DRAFT_724716 [Hyaloraphidium curvatum]|nr:hypothetical protein DFJ74DRAFT_724716 [Hyaloraphidium curvatum]